MGAQGESRHGRRVSTVLSSIEALKSIIRTVSWQHSVANERTPLLQGSHSGGLRPVFICPYISSMLCKLAIVKVRIKSVRCKQALMIALLYNLSVFHNKDNISLPDGRQTMSHYKACPALHHGKERFLNLNLCSCINR